MHRLQWQVLPLAILPKIRFWDCLILKFWGNIRFWHITVMILTVDLKSYGSWIMPRKNHFQVYFLHRCSLVFEFVLIQDTANLHFHFLSLQPCLQCAASLSKESTIRHFHHSRGDSGGGGGERSKGAALVVSTQQFQRQQLKFLYHFFAHLSSSRCALSWYWSLKRWLWICSYNI